VAALPPFPNYTQIPSRLPISVWQLLRVCSLIGALVVVMLLIAAPDTGLFVMWKVVIPLLPLLFMTAPGLWRNLCPLAASNQMPRWLGITKGLAPPAWLKEYGYVIAISLFVGFVALRKLGMDDSGPWSALLLIGAMAGGFTGGLVLKGKSGWCSTMCPLLPVQRIYGQTPFVLLANSHCQPCVGCVKNCYDFNPKAAYLADLKDGDAYWSGYRKLFVGAFPGLIYAFFQVPDHPAASVGEIIGRIAVYMLVSAGSFLVLSSFAKVSAHKLTTLYGAIAFSIFYWFGAPNLYAAWSDGPVPDAATWGLRAAFIAIAAAWLLRTFTKEHVFEREARKAARPARIGALAERSLAGRKALRAGEPEVSFEPEGKRVAVKEGLSLLEIAEANTLEIEAGCRMGICGADPVAIKDGMENLSAISDDERSTLDRLGLAPNTRMACCARVQGPVSVCLTPDKAATPQLSRIQFSYDRSIERVVVVGNGIAGVTAADHVRRRHPECAIDIVADESHQLYNRMGISRLIYGRSAMQGLYLNPDSWYDERNITTWLNTQALRIDRAGRTVVLGTGETLEYHRLILATGSSSFVPPIEGFGAQGTFVLRSAEDALAIRSFAQRHAAKRAVVAGGGLLGLEAAYALHKLGLRTTVLERSDRLLRRQLDQRAADILRAYIEGLGMEIAMEASTSALSANGRVNLVMLDDDRYLPVDLFLVAAGITPNVALARAADLSVGRGVIVDDRMRTSDPAIFAAGDVAEFDSAVLGLWPTAVEQAEVAAENALGGDRAYAGSVPVTILKVVGIELTSIGRFEPEGAHEEVIALEDSSGQRYRKLVIDADGRIAGAILLGYSREVAPVRTAISRGWDVRGKLDALRAGRWDVLAELSGDRPLLAAAPAGVG
jgi:NADPH-dependent 2,4-dienoyl-CoA reductase/sulfur reductase-like enzyme/ferredoxin